MIYYYDGSFQGLLCCVFESFVCGETPEKMAITDGAQLSFLEQKWIETDQVRYARVRSGIEENLPGGTCSC